MRPQRPHRKPLGGRERGLRDPASWRRGTRDRAADTLRHLPRCLQVVPRPPHHLEAEVSQRVLALLLGEDRVAGGLPGFQQPAVLDASVELPEHDAVEVEVDPPDPAPAGFEHLALLGRERQPGTRQHHPASRFIDTFAVPAQEPDDPPRRIDAVTTRSAGEFGLQVLTADPESADGRVTHHDGLLERQRSREVDHRPRRESQRMAVHYCHVLSDRGAVHRGPPRDPATSASISGEVHAVEGRLPQRQSVHDGRGLVTEHRVVRHGVNCRVDQEAMAFLLAQGRVHRRGEVRAAPDALPLAACVQASDLVVAVAAAQRLLASQHRPRVMFHGNDSRRGHRKNPVRRSLLWMN